MSATTTSGMDRLTIDENVENDSQPVLPSEPVLMDLQNAAARIERVANRKINESNLLSIMDEFYK